MTKDMILKNMKAYTSFHVDFENSAASLVLGTLNLYQVNIAANPKKSPRLHQQMRENLSVDRIKVKWSLLDFLFKQRIVVQKIILIRPKFTPILEKSYSIQTSSFLTFLQDLWTSPVVIQVKDGQFLIQDTPIKIHLEFHDIKMQIYSSVY